MDKSLIGLEEYFLIEVVKVPDHFSVTLQNLSVVDLHFLFLLWLDQEDSHLEELWPAYSKRAGSKALRTMSS